MDLDASFDTPIARDPVVGVRVTRFELTPPTATARITIDYVCESGAIERTEVAAITGQEAYDALLAALCKESPMAILLSFLASEEQIPAIRPPSFASDTATLEERA